MRNARNIVIERVHSERRMICIYLTGSMLLEDPLLGGCTDIDMIFVHDNEQTPQREIVRLTDEVHVDIAHYSQSMFHPPRTLRLNPWIGSFLCENPIVLHDSQHWFEFTQANVCSQFMLPEFTIQRARPFIDSARDEWFALDQEEAQSSPDNLKRYFKILENAANSIAILTGTPLTERRFMMEFPECAQLVEKAELAAGLVNLFAGEEIPAAQWDNWLASWRSVFLQAGQLPECPVRMHSCRLAYYERAIKALREQFPVAATWLLLRTWTQAICLLPPTSEVQNAWQTACQILQLDSTHFTGRLEALDTYLDSVEEALDEWSIKNGLQPLG